MKAKNQEVIEGIRRNNSRVLNSFQAKNLPYVRKMILSNSGVEEDVEDIMQEAMIFLYEKVTVSDLELSSSIHHYFYGVCKNMWRNRLKKQKSIYYLDQVPETNFSDCTISEKMNKDYRNKVFKTHFEKLHDISRKVLELSFEGKKAKEIAKDLDCTEGAVRKRRFSAKNKLIQMIEKDPLYLELIS